MDATTTDIAASNSLADLAAAPIATGGLKGTKGRCDGCNTSSTFLLPLHGARGGPLRCPLCIGAWHAEHGKRRRHGRIVIRALAAFLNNGGKIGDIDKLKQSAICGDFLGHDVLGHEAVLDPLGYLADTASTKGETIELTSELLADAIRLAHPDYHPPERQDLARRTTQGLLALQPFVFPAPKPKPPDPRNEYMKGARAPRDASVTREPAYPCADCRDTVPYFYCSPCRAEWDKRQAKRREEESAKQRKWYAQRKARRYHSKACEACGATIKVSGGLGKGKRKDARFCSDACRQKAHRKAVTAKKKSAPGICFSRDNADAEVVS